MSSAESSSSPSTLEWLKKKVVEIQQFRNHDRQDINELQEEVQRLQHRVEVLEERTPSPSQKTYDEMDKDDKATVLREAMKREARKQGGTAMMKYKDVMRLFDNYPSAGHCYDIMERADEDENAFQYGEGPDGERRVTYDERHE